MEARLRITFSTSNTTVTTAPTVQPVNHGELIAANEPPESHVDETDAILVDSGT